MKKKYMKFIIMTAVIIVAAIILIVVSKVSGSPKNDNINLKTMKVEYSNKIFINGTVQTVLDLYDSSVETSYISDQTLIEFILKFEPWLTYWNSLINYAKIEDKIFVHGWIPSFECDNKMHIEKDWENGDWSTAKWLNGMYAWSTGAKLEDKTIYCGHWHTEWGHTNLHNKKEKIYEPFIDDGIVALDACTVISNKCNCITFEI